VCAQDGDVETPGLNRARFLEDDADTQAIRGALIRTNSTAHRLTVRAAPTLQLHKPLAGSPHGLAGDAMKTATPVPRPIVRSVFSTALNLELESELDAVGNKGRANVSASAGTPNAATVSKQSPKVPVMQRSFSMFGDRSNTASGRSAAIVAHVNAAASRSNMTTVHSGARYVFTTDDSRSRNPESSSMGAPTTPSSVGTPPLARSSSALSNTSLFARLASSAKLQAGGQTVSAVPSIIGKRPRPTGEVL
jgi:hypothetical protein